MSSGLIGIALVGFVALSVLAARAGVDAVLRQRARTRWEQHCEASGLTLTEPREAAFPRASGHIDGIAVSAWVDELRTSGITQQFIRLRADVSGIPEVFIRRRAPEFERSTWPEVVTGDPAFDDLIRVSGPSAPAARAWLTPDRRAQLLTLVQAGGTWSVGDGAIGLSQRGLAPSESAWTSQIAQVVQVAKRLLGS